MNKTVLCSLVALALGAPLLAEAAEGWVVADISLQAGPDTDFPTLAMLDAGTPVSIQGCIDGWTWCDVIVDQDNRGWVPGTFIEEEYAGRPVVLIDSGPRIGIPIVSFSLGTYWNRHYHNRPFYAQRQRFESHRIAAHAPPRPSTIVATAPRHDVHVHAGGVAQTGAARVETQARSGETAQERSARIAGMTGSRTTSSSESGMTSTVPHKSATQPARDAADAQSGRHDTRTARHDTPTDRGPTDTSADRRAAQTRPEPQPAKPTDAPARMNPHDEQPIAQKPQPAAPPQQQPTRVAQNEHARAESAQQSRREQPKSKDELKKPDPKHHNNGKDKDDDGGGR